MNKAKGYEIYPNTQLRSDQKARYKFSFFCLSLLKSLLFESKVSIKAFSTRIPFKILTRCYYSATLQMWENNQLTPNCSSSRILWSSWMMPTTNHHLKMNSWLPPLILRFVALNNEQKPIFVIGTFSRIEIHYESLLVWVSTDSEALSPSSGLISKPQALSFLLCPQIWKRRPTCTYQATQGDADVTSTAPI